MIPNSEFSIPNSLVNLPFTAVGAVLTLSACAIWIALRPRSAAARRAIIIAASIYFAASVYSVPFAVSKLLTPRYRPLDRADVGHGNVVIVVLGAGNETVFGWEQSMSVPNQGAAARVLEAWRVYRLLNPERVITSGGTLGPEDLSEPSGINMRDRLVQFGVPADRIVVESQSRNTRDEAVIIAPMLRQMNADHLVLVTSAVHMRRALGAFRAVGWDGVPAVAPDAHYFDPWFHFVLPTSHGLSFSGDVAHELIGLPYYWIRGWWRN
jgi:uncharacterized SAM-binding protein YcdF (DUF218 family)